jgi:hypothetical protein
MSGAIVSLSSCLFYNNTAEDVSETWPDDKASLESSHCICFVNITYYYDTLTFVLLPTSCFPLF